MKHNFLIIPLCLALLPRLCVSRPVQMATIYWTEPRKDSVIKTRLKLIKRALPAVNRLNQIIVEWLRRGKGAEWREREAV